MSGDPLIVCRLGLKTAVLFLQCGFSRRGDQITALAALYLGLPDHPGGEELLQQVVQGSGSHRDPAARQGLDLGHDVRPALFLPETQENIEHLLRQCLKFPPGHQSAPPIIEYRYYSLSIISNIAIVKYIFPPEGNP